MLPQAPLFWAVMCLPVWGRIPMARSARHKNWQMQKPSMHFHRARRDKEALKRLATMVRLKEERTSTNSSSQVRPIQTKARSALGITTAHRDPPQTCAHSKHHSTARLHCTWARKKLPGLPCWQAINLLQALSCKQEAQRAKSVIRPCLLKAIRHLCSQNTAPKFKTVVSCLLP